MEFLHSKPEGEDIVIMLVIGIIDKREVRGER